MINVDFDAGRSIAVLHLKDALTKEDFERARQVLDPQIEKAGRINGIVVHAKEFPGWDSFGALASHLRFVRDHHRKIRRLAVCTDAAIGGVAEKVASHFVSAEIRAFNSADLEQAKAWVAGG